MTTTESTTQPASVAAPGSAATYAAVGDTEVPWIISDFETEYQALRTRGALFDHSSVGLFSLAGDRALEALQQVLARDLEYLADDQLLPSLVLDDHGRLVDVVVVYAMEGRYLVESGFGHGTRTGDRLAEAAAGAGVELTDLRGSWSVVGIEGPYSWDIVGQLLGPEMTTLPFQTVLEFDWQGTALHCARTGFSAEYGYKVLGPIEALRTLWAAVSAELPPAGQAVLESIMTEVRQPIAHREVERSENVIEAGLNWLVDRNKGDYTGRDKVEAMWAEGPRTQRLGGRSPAAVEPGAPVLAGDTEIGEVVSCDPSPGLAGYVVQVQVAPRLAAAGLELQVRTGDGPVAVTTLSSPYVVPASWSVPIF